MTSNPKYRALPAPTKLYVGAVVAAGAATIVQSFYDLAAHPIGWNWIILAILTLASGSATVRLPGLPATISVSETFVFTSVLLFGSSAGTLTVALDALVISFWSYRKGHPFYKIIFNVCALPLTIWIAAHIFFALPGIEPLVHTPRQDPIRIKELVGPLLVFTIVYFSLNSWIITFAISLEKRLSPFRVWRDNFVWLSLNYFGGASVAVLLVSYTKDLDYTYLVVIIPLLIVLYFTFSMSMGRVEDANRHLTQLNALYMSTIETLAMAIDAKDQITHGHIRRVQTYAVALAKEVGVTEPHLIKAVEAAALLHDMGKLAVPEYILNKPGPLTEAEFEKMKLHASVGADILSAIDFPYPVVPIVRHHHENWDGTGYPDGLSATNIPIGARILSVVDCFDALTSDRPYRPRLSDKEAIHILTERRGSMYDPLVVDTFIRVQTRIAPAAMPLPARPSLVAITGTSALQLTAPPSTKRLDEIAASTEEMLALFDLAKRLTSVMKLQDIGDLISNHLRRLIPFSICVFFVYETEFDELVASHAVGDNSSLVSGLRVNLGQRLSGWVGANRHTIRNSDPILDLGEVARGMSPRPRSCLSTPLIAGKELAGVLTLYSSATNAFTEEHQRVIEIVAQQVAPIVKSAAERDTSHQELQWRDEFVKLPTLEHLLQIIATPLGNRRPAEPTALIFIEVENLGVTGDESGRFSVDHFLTNVLAAVRRNLRGPDLLFRRSEHKLVAALLETDKGGAEEIGARIRRDLGLHSGASHPWSLRVVVVATPEDGLSIDELVDVAGRYLPLAEGDHGTTNSTPPGAIH